MLNHHLSRRNNEKTTSLSSVQDIVNLLSIIHIIRIIDGSKFYPRPSLVLLLYYLYCLCNSVKERFFFLAFVLKAGAKVKALSLTTKHYRKFFSVLFSVTSRGKSTSVKRTFFCGWTAKIRTLKLHFQIIWKIFFSRRSNLLSPDTGRFCQHVNLNTLRLLQSGCKSRTYCHTIQT